MNGSTRRFLSLLALVAALSIPAVAPAQPKAIATAETNMKATAELYECKRKEGVLTIKVRFKASEKTTIDLPYGDTYVVDVAAGKKYQILRDSEKKALATPNEHYNDRVRADLAGGATYNAWWKFPAPPSSTKKITFTLPKSEPLEDVPITDAQ
jgi:hypothetical protein